MSYVDNIEANLYEFITAKAKANKIKIENLPKLCGFSRSSVYRYMKGTSPIGAEAEAKFISILKLNEADRKLFHKLIQLTAFDESLLEARQSLDTFVFGNVEAASPPPLEFIYYDNEKYFRTAREVFDNILSHASDPGFSCCAKIINCMRKDILPQVSIFLKQILLSELTFSAEHLVTFMEHDYAQNIEIFMNLITILPLSGLKSYSVYQNQEADSHGSMLFRDSMIIEVSFNQSEHIYYWISFSENRLSSCITFSDRFLYSFIMDNYSELRKKHNTLLFNTKGLDVIGDHVHELEGRDDYYLIKPNPCYDIIPPDVYHSMAKRCKGELQPLADTLTPGKSIEDMLDYFLNRLEVGNKISYTTKQTNVFSEKGLLELVETGKLSDHFEGLPNFSESELKAILQTLHDRNLDPKDPYRLYISKKDFFENGLLLCISKSGSMMVEYNKDRYCRAVFDNIYLENKNLTNIFIDYIENHLIPNHTMPPEEATALLRELIDGLNESEEIS